MSAIRNRLLAAAAVCGVLAPTSDCWAQAYGGRAVVEHNDLRWFEPVELDLDGQMPRQDAGFFFSVDKLNWATVNPRVEIGSPGLTVDSEQIFPAPSVAVALSALEEQEQLGFVTNLEENLANTGLSFVVANTQGTPELSDDVEVPFDVSGAGSVLGLQTLIDAFNLGNADPNLVLRVGGAPQPYAVRNGIRDALPDAGFAWGERYEFGYSDGERGWMATILDGPESVSGGTFGAGNTSLGDDPDDGSGLALGFGSVPVNFELPTPDFLTGFRDYFNNDDGISGGTQFGPLLFTRTVGTIGVDQDNLGFQAPTFDGTGTLALGGFSATALGLAGSFQTQQNLADPFEPLLSALLTSVFSQLGELQGFLLTGGPDDMADPLFAQFQAGQTAAAQAVASALALQTALNDAIANNPGGMVNMDELAVQTAQLVADLAALDGQVATLTIEADGDAADGAVVVGDAQRLADDIDGNGSAGQILVRADIDNNGIIADDEVIAVIPNFGDLFQFNVFFNDVTVRNRTQLSGVELMRTHQLSTRHRLQQGRWDDVRFSWGVRFLDLQDDFSFAGTGSILGLTTVDTEVENQIIGPQLGLQWTRKDGPWSFVLEGRGTLGYNIVDVDQRGLFGVDAIPGALNRSAVARTTASVDGERYDEFSPLAELRAQVKYRLASAVTLQAGYTAKYVGNIHRGSIATRFRAPDFGFIDDTTYLFTNGLNIGVEFRH